MPLTVTSYKSEFIEDLFAPSQILLRINYDLNRMIDQGCDL